MTDTKGENKNKKKGGEECVSCHLDPCNMTNRQGRKRNRETHVWWDALDHGDQQNIQKQGDRQDTRQGRNAHQRSIQ